MNKEKIDFNAILNYKSEGVIEKIQATEVGLEEEYDQIILCFADRENFQYLLLSQRFDEIEGDKEFCYLELNYDIFSGYKLIKSIWMRDNKIQFILNEAGVKALNKDFILVEIISKEVNIDYIKLVLLRIFKGSNKVKILQKII